LDDDWLLVGSPGIGLVFLLVESLNEYFYLSRIKQRSTCLCFYETDVIVFSFKQSGLFNSQCILIINLSNFFGQVCPFVESNKMSIWVIFLLHRFSSVVDAGGD
jgi:hypothetical protein